MKDVTTEQTDAPADKDGLPRWIWCLTANVRSHPVDELFNVCEKERRGTKHFAPGARVYVYPVQWGDGWERMVVVGKKRGSHRYIRKVMLGSMLENFRLKKVYSPSIINWMCGTGTEIPNHGHPWGSGITFEGWDDSAQTKETIESMVDSHKRYLANPAVYLASRKFPR